MSIARWRRYLLYAEARRKRRYASAYAALTGALAEGILYQAERCTRGGVRLSGPFPTCAYLLLINKANMASGGGRLHGANLQSLLKRLE